MAKEVYRSLAIRKGLIYGMPARNSECIPKEILKMIDNEMHKLLKEYPCLKGEICEIVFEDIGNDIARASIDNNLHMKLKFNIYVFSNTYVLNQLLNMYPNTISFKNGLYGYIKHELVHLLEYRYCILIGNSKDEIWETILNGWYANEILKEALNTCLLPENDAIIESKISVLARYNASEAIAEACSSSVDNELIKCIKNLVMKKWR